MEGNAERKESDDAPERENESFEDYVEYLKNKYRGFDEHHVTAPSDSQSQGTRNEGKNAEYQRNTVENGSESDYGEEPEATAGEGRVEENGTPERTSDFPIMEKLHQDKGLAETPEEGGSSGDIVGQTGLDTNRPEGVGRLERESIRSE